MDNFRLFLESLDPSSVVHFALEARRMAGVTRCARFGDCNDVCDETIKLLSAAGIRARREGSYFWAGEENGDFEHSWVVVDNEFILDPTIDQFFSELDEDMETMVPGIYYSHPEWDGDKYIKRYNKQ